MLRIDPELHTKTKDNVVSCVANQLLAVSYRSIL